MWGSIHFIVMPKCKPFDLTAFCTSLPPACPDTGSHWEACTVGTIEEGWAGKDAGGIHVGFGPSRLATGLGVGQPSKI